MRRALICPCGRQWMPESLPAKRLRAWGGASSSSCGFTRRSYTTTSAFRSSSRPRTVMSPGSPGPAPIRYTAPALICSGVREAGVDRGWPETGARRSSPRLEPFQEVGLGLLPLSLGDEPAEVGVESPAPRRPAGDARALAQLAPDLSHDLH